MSDLKVEACDIFKKKIITNLKSAFSYEVSQIDYSFGRNNFGIIAQTKAAFASSAT